MKRQIFSLALITALLAAPLCSNAQTETERFIPGSTLEGVCYYLPRTALRVVVKAECTVTRPGDFAKYAFKYLRLQDVPTQATVTWRIVSVELQPYGVPDKNKAYTIHLKGRTVAPLVGLSRDGILLSINTDADETSLPALPEGIPAPKPVNPRDYMNQEMLSAGSVSKMAQLVAQEIYDIRDSRNALIRGEADNTPKDGAQLQLMLDQMDKQTAALESLFKGTQETSTIVRSLSVIPSEVTEKMLLCRFSQKLGLVNSDDLSGEPIYLSIENMETLPAVVEDEATDRKLAKVDKGVFYNVPARMKATVFSAQQTFTSLETPMGQFGNVLMLSNTLFDKKTTTKVTFFQQSGGVKDVME